MSQPGVATHVQFRKGDQSWTISRGHYDAIVTFVAGGGALGALPEMIPIVHPRWNVTAALTGADTGIYVTDEDATRAAQAIRSRLHQVTGDFHRTLLTTALEWCEAGGFQIKPHQAP